MNRLKHYLTWLAWKVSFIVFIGCSLNQVSFCFPPKAFLHLQQDFSWENAPFQGSRVLQGEEQQSVRQLPGGGRRGVRPWAPPPQWRPLLRIRLQVQTRQAVQVQETRDSIITRWSNSWFWNLWQNSFVGDPLYIKKTKTLNTSRIYASMSIENK